LNLDRYVWLRDVIAYVVVAVACPLALFFGSMADCLVQGFEPKCAQNAIGIAPLLLFLSGVVAGLVTRGWTGLLFGFLGTITGMVVILGLSFGVSEPVPLDPFSGIIATIWFGVPTVTGYGVGRLTSRLLERRRGARGAKGASPTASDSTGSGT
jgi:hypothetical protein